MTFSEALTALDQGLRVKLPSWSNGVYYPAYYQYINNAKNQPVLADFRDSGDILIVDKVPMDFLTNTNWEIYNG